MLNFIQPRAPSLIVIAEALIFLFTESQSDVCNTPLCDRAVVSLWKWHHKQRLPSCKHEGMFRSSRDGSLDLWKSRYFTRHAWS